MESYFTSCTFLRNFTKLAPTAIISSVSRGAIEQPTLHHITKSRDQFIVVIVAGGDTD